MYEEGGNTRDRFIHRLGIDFDSDDLDKLLPKLRRALEYSKYYEGIVELLRTRRGYHIHLHLDTPLSIEEDLFLRYAIGDSPGRLWLEERRLKESVKYGVFLDTFDLMSGAKEHGSGGIGSEELICSIRIGETIKLTPAVEKEPLQLQMLLQSLSRHVLRSV